jgi:hypothetical protein
MKFVIWEFLENLSMTFRFHSIPTRITGTLHEEVFTFVKISRYIFLINKHFSDKIDRIKINKLYSMCFSVNRVFCVIRSKNIVEIERPQMAMQYGLCALHSG